MKPRFVTILIGIATLAAAAFATDLPPAWPSWLYSRTLTAPHPDVLNYAIIDRDVFAHSENHLADLSPSSSPRVCGKTVLFPASSLKSS